MKLLPKDFYDISPKHLSLMMSGHKESKVDTYRLVRLLMFTMVRLMGDPKASPKTPEALWELPGDEKEAKIDEESMRQIFKRFKNGDSSIAD